MNNQPSTPRNQILLLPTTPTSPPTPNTPFFRVALQSPPRSPTEVKARRLAKTRQASLLVDGVVGFGDNRDPNSAISTAAVNGSSNSNSNNTNTNSVGGEGVASQSQNGDAGTGEGAAQGSGGGEEKK